MKIIKQGIPPHEKEITKVCSKCKSELLVTISDLKSDRDGSYVICPVCSTMFKSTFIATELSEFYDKTIQP
jgi:DNA-directed RNA polymerase subunit RPC12/RpoP